MPSMSLSNISLFDAIYTQRAIRRFKTDPVPDEAIHAILEAATMGPSARNLQPGRFLVVRDPETKRRIGEWYQEGLDAVYESAESRNKLGLPPPPKRMDDTTYRLGDHMADVPVLLFACIDHGNARPGKGSILRGSNIYPAVQNLLLAARGLGLGSVLTTIYRSHEQVIKEFLGIPDNVETVALIPIGYPADGQEFGGSKRKPVEEVSFYDRWGQKKQN